MTALRTLGALDALRVGAAIAREVGMDRNKLLLVGGAIVLVLFLAYMLGPGGGAIPR